jgi:HK97 family phage portal protein
MNIMQKVLNSFGYIKATRTSAILPSQRNTLYRYGKPKNFTALIEAYEKELWLFRCVNLIATTIAGLPFKLVKVIDTNTGRIEKEISNTIINDLIENADDSDDNSTYNNLMELTCVYLELTGNAYWLMELVGQKPISIVGLNSSRMTVIPAETQLVKGYEYFREDNEKVLFKPEEILQFKYANPKNMYYGLGTTVSGAREIETYGKGVDANKGIFENGMNLDYALMTDQQLTQENYNRLKLQLDQKHAGSDNAHKTLVLEKGLKVGQVGTALKELEYSEGIRILRESICGLFGVPPVLVGILDRATYSNYKESEKIFFKNTIIPKVRKIQDVVSLMVRRFDDKLRFRFDMSNVEALKEDMFIKSQIAMNFFNIGIPTNEIIEGLELPFELQEESETDIELKKIEQEKKVKEIEGKAKEFEELNKQIVREGKWKAFINTTNKIERVYRGIIDKHFENLKVKVLTAFNRATQKALDDKDYFDYEKEVKIWNIKSSKIHKLSLNEGAKRIIKEANLDISFNLQNPRVVSLLEKYGLEKAKEVMDSLKNDIKDALKKGVEEGESIPDMAKRLGGVFEDYKANKYKAERIARTEVISMNNAGALESMNQAGMEKKEWITAIDERTRDAHKKADGQAVKVDEPFEVGGEELMFPGDRRGSGENVINCRCTLGAVE